MRDLENEVAQLKAKLSTARAPEAAVADVAALPVEVLEPAEPTADDLEGVEGAIVAGYDEDGVEILYVGEAASGQAYVPTVELSGTGTVTAPRETAARAPAGRSTPPPALPVASDRLDAHGQVGPKVSALASSTRPLAVAPSEPKSSYAKAYQSLRERKHDLAMRLFREFLERYPTHEYADNAQYWLGESFYDQRDFASAVAEFGKVIQSYPKGNKVPAAKLKIAYCHLALGQSQKARALLEKLIGEHPDSEPAKLAAAKLKNL